MSRKITQRPGFHPVDRVTGAEIMYTDLAFVTTHPPDVPARSRIVAVCGTTDVEDRASPENDGWFFSDFYLFHYLLNPTYTHTANQVWLTCLEPEYLVNKYNEYAHGDPRKERRVVLDKERLAEIKQAGNVRVVNRAILLERFVKTAEEQAIYAKRDGGTLIVLILGHGNEENHGVHLGGKNPFSDNSILGIERFKKTLPSDLNITLMLTSCYSGGWLIQPDIHHKKLMNVTGVAASGPRNETRSWSLSRSAGRACGSTIASAIVNQVIDIEKSDQTEQDPRLHPTYIDLTSSIYDMATSLDRLFADQNVHFSAQDDDWEVHWRKRIGVPLTRFKDRWEALRQIPPSGVKDPGGEEASIPLSNRRVGSLKIDLHRLAKDYEKAKPGRDSLASNVALHGSLLKFSRGKLPNERIPGILDKVIYRLNMMSDADEYVRAMGLEFPSCHGYSLDNDYKRNPVKDSNKSKAWDYIKAAGLFPSPLPPCMPKFTKPQNYLAIVLAERCKSEEEIKERVQKALEWKELRASELLPHVQAYKIIDSHHIRTRLFACFAAFREFGHKLHLKAHAIYPSHRGYAAVPTQDLPSYQM